MAFGGPRSSCVRPGAHSARRQDSRKDLMPYRMALHSVSAGAHAPHSDETLGPMATRGSSHPARRLRSLAFPCSSTAREIGDDDATVRQLERGAHQGAETVDDHVRQRTLAKNLRAGIAEIRRELVQEN